ncbi:flagellar basal body-associated protein FliL [Saccharospirillum alexandrii]|uniref:flagellar basal body-associated FliL family protein n=1 Tax=Saccharospirillum alexandrii TaxID=2448477 RepID=UPI0037354039
MLPLSYIVKPFHLLSLAVTLWFCLSLPASAEDAIATGPTYVELEPSFTINYGEGSRLRYLQASISLLVPDGTAALEVSTHSDAIRHEIIMLISAQDRETLTSTTGRSELQAELLEQIQGYMEQETGAPQVDQVLFTAFVIQG